MLYKLHYFICITAVPKIFQPN